MLALLPRLKQLTAVVADILRLPEAELCFHAARDTERITATYRNFTKPHPRYKLIRNKTIGAALIDTTHYAGADAYIESIARRNFGGHFARRAMARGYRFLEIDRNMHVDGINAINASLPVRQGKAMAPSYRKRIDQFVDHEHYRYYGVLDREGKLMAYCEVGLYGNFALLSRLLGYRNNDGIMHFMIVEIISALMREQLVRFVMYDTYFGASEGLRNFKNILGFKPYRVRYRLDTDSAAPRRARPCYRASH